jgi:acetyltransferase-like isoleucine patch superfamily enzyme
MIKPEEIRPGTRNPADVAMQDRYLRDGQVPAGMVLRKGLASLIRDPFLLIILNMPGPLGFKLRQIYYRRTLGYLGCGVVVDPGVDIIGPKNVYVDNFCYLGRKCQLVAPEGYISIGKRCHVTGWVLGHGGVEIGNYVGCAGEILSATDSHQGGHRMSGPMVPSDHRSVRKRKVTIEDDAFIGHFSMVMPGVHIGRGAVVGPHSLVVSNVKPWTVVMGSPAKVIGTREPVRFADPD